MIGSDGPGVGGAAPPGLLVRKTGAGRTSASLGAYRSLGPLGKASGVPAGREEGRALLLLGQNGTGRGLCPQETAALPRRRPPVLVSESSEPGRGTRGSHTGPACLSVASPLLLSHPATLLHTHPHTRVTHAHALPLSHHVLHAPALLRGDEHEEDPPQRCLPPVHTTASFCPSRSSKSLPEHGQFGPGAGGARPEATPPPPGHSGPGPRRVCHRWRRQLPGVGPPQRGTSDRRSVPT